MEEQSHVAQWTLCDPRQSEKIAGAVVGLFIGLNKEGQPIVDYPSNPTDGALPARTTQKISETDGGNDVLLLFEDGDPVKPVILGFLRDSTEQLKSADSVSDHERLEFHAKKEIVFRCGDASITLTRAGKILIRGKYLLSSSSGVHMLKGAVIHLN